MQLFSTRKVKMLLLHVDTTVDRAWFRPLLRDTRSAEFPVVTGGYQAGGRLFIT